MKNIKEIIIDFFLGIIGIVVLGIMILGGLAILSYLFPGQLAESIKDMYDSGETMNEIKKGNSWIFHIIILIVVVLLYLFSGTRFYKKYRMQDKMDKIVGYPLIIIFGLIIIFTVIVNIINIINWFT